MVKITNGKEIFKVPDSAFETLFKSLGFVKIENPPVVKAKKEEENNKEKDEIEEISEKPISEWTATEVKKFAKAKGIDISGTKSAAEAKEKVKEFLD